MRVLVVEDERKIAGYLKHGLEEGGYAVDLAYDGQEALDWSAMVNFDAIILDVLLPNLDGFSVCKQLRDQGNHTPILMLTALDGVDDRVNGLDYGADDYLPKPFAIKEVLARLRAITRRVTIQPRDSRIYLADLELDTVSLQVSRAGKPIKLTPKEHSILEYLMRANGRIVTRTMLAEHIWSYDVFNQSNVIDVYIRNLRRKIDDSYSTKLLHTIRGSGYRLSVESNNGET
jgi:DNA-binding response OmpR family regulator